MSYYDHDVLMSLKQGPWDPDPLRNEHHRLHTRQKRVASRRRMRGIFSLAVVAVGLMVLGASGFWA